MQTGTLLLIIGALGFQMISAQQVPSCMGLPNGYTLNNALNDQDYYLCSNNIPIPMQCQMNFVFCAGATACSADCNPITTPTVPTSPVVNPTGTTPTFTPPPVVTPPATTALPSGVSCSNKADGTMYPGTTCSAYYMCVGGVAQPGNCLNNYTFDSDNGSCTLTVCS